MKLFLNIFLRLVFYPLSILAIVVVFALQWSHGHKKQVPPHVVTKIEHVFEGLSPKARTFIGAAEVEFIGFREGFAIDLENSYINFSNNIIASVPKIHLKLKISDLLLGRIKFREITLDQPKFVASGSVSAQDFSDSVSRDFFDLYKSMIYSIFERVDKNSNSIPVEKIDMNDAEFSFNKQGKYETWKIDEANLRFFSLQNTTYLSTEVKTTLFDRKSEISVNARLLEQNKIMLKVDYKNLSSKFVSNFTKGLDWFNLLNPVLEGTSAIVMDKDGTSTTISLDTDIKFNKEGIEDTRIGFNGQLDLTQNEDKIIKPKVHGGIKLKDINMEKLPKIWPEQYGAKVRADVLKNYTKGTFNNVEIGFDYSFADTDFSAVDSEKFSISGNIVDTDVIYSPDFPAIEKADGRFFYDGDNVEVDLKKGNLGKLVFGDSKIRINGLNDPKTVLEIDGVAKGELSALKPLLKSILKGRDKEFFYNTHDMTADSDIKFYYKDNINNGFDPDVLKMDIAAKLSNVSIKQVVKDVDLTSNNLEMKVDNNGLTVSGDASLNSSPSQIKAFVGFVKENDIALNLVSEAQTEVLDKLLPGVGNYADGTLELEFEYKSAGDRNYFAGKIDSVDAKVSYPILGWEKPKGTFASASFGGKYMPGKAVQISELQIVSGNSISTGNMLVSLNKDIADEVYFNKLSLGGNDAEVYFSKTQLSNQADKKSAQSFIIKINGKTFNVSKLLNSFEKIASGDNGMVFDMQVDDLIMANDIHLKDGKAYLRCSVDKCHDGNFVGNIATGGKISFVMKPKKAASGEIDFSLDTDNAGDIIKGLDISDNVEGGAMSISGDIDGTAVDETNGIIVMTDYKLKKAPVLTKIFSLASFTGMLDLLSGSGVKMEKLKGAFKVKDNFISITDLRSYGDSLGFTLQGNIDMNKTAIDFSGAVTPSYSANTMLGKIPLVGALFKAKEGEGLIATNYSVKGKYPDVDVSVNPLSALTPGFLRNIWGEAETDIDKKEKRTKLTTKSNRDIR